MPESNIRQVCIPCSFKSIKTCKCVKPYRPITGKRKKGPCLVFGKYKGVEVKNVPEDYIKWILGSVYFSADNKAEIKRLYYV